MQTILFVLRFLLIALEGTDPKGISAHVSRSRPFSPRDYNECMQQMIR